MKILVVNAGSSSLKYQLFDMDNGSVLAKGNCERIGVDGAVTHKRPGKEDYKAQIPLANHDDAIALVLRLLTDPELGVISDMSEVAAVGHRVAHGGEKLRKSTIFTEEDIQYLYSIVGINPLHGPPAIKGIEACRRIMKDIPQIGVFDTSFYGGIPDYAYTYAIPYEYYEKYRIRRYGFHGTSHRFVSGRAAEMLGRPYDSLRMITCHIGNGSSISAIKNGVCIDTSMGFTPQEGLPMGTRSGSIDPTIIPFLMKNEGLDADGIDDMLNRKSGLYGVSGISSDCREVLRAMEEGNERARIAIDMLVNSMKKIIGSYVAEMNGVDAVVFTAGIGENDRYIRERVLENMEAIGIYFDKEKNATCPRGVPSDVSKDNSPVRALVIPTDEEYMIALDTYKLITK